MPNCRSIPADAWHKARKTLIFYFARRHKAGDAEDLAHEVLMAVWNRDDYVFENPEDFMLVCYGFARRISSRNFRQTAKASAEELSEAIPASPVQDGSAARTEMKILLDEVYRLGRAGLKKQDWDLVQQAATADRDGMAESLGLRTANNARVRLHRSRNKLAALAGWTKKKV